MPRLTATERYALRDVREAWVQTALRSGRFKYNQHSTRIRCTICGRSGYTSGYWLDNCLKGHPFVCQCGRAFSTRHAISTHRRHMEQDLMHNATP